MLDVDQKQYDTDKIENRYLERYADVLQPWVGKAPLLLELGVKNGGSLLLWRDYFPQGTIVGIDIELPAGFTPPERVSLFEGSQGDPRFLSEVADQTAPNGYDIIIDDASHVGYLTKISFWHLFENHLKPGGLFIIEDWGTGYWGDWPDGRSLALSRYAPKGRDHHPRWLFLQKVLHKIGLRPPWRNHSQGMVGLVKQLVDEQGAHDVTRRTLKGDGAARPSRFEKMLIMPSIVVVQKRK